MHIQLCTLLSPDQINQGPAYNNLFQIFLVPLLQDSTRAIIALAVIVVVLLLVSIAMGIVIGWLVWRGRRRSLNLNPAQEEPEAFYDDVVPQDIEMEINECYQAKH